ncbi:hypothetical protein VHEMI03022 [[Torrubiella] hemipterigena]|uniref:Uncharacterized protein n=1 Tax=[Torrubiella] hemipterigena TaxID=1531966 RepID=A0A0A1SXC3_9HYPO|nr:hypothetical protein VHEMI03022 [[Torrubiella] hemipterigena]
MAVKARPLNCSSVPPPTLDLRGRVRLRVINTGGHPKTKYHIRGTRGVYESEKLTIHPNTSNMPIENYALTPILTTQPKTDTTFASQRSGIRDAQLTVERSPAEKSVLQSALGIRPDNFNRPTGSINRTSWVPPTSNTALLALPPTEWKHVVQQPATAQELVVPHFKTYGEDHWIELTMNNFDERGHPLHLLMMTSGFCTAMCCGIRRLGWAMCRDLDTLPAALAANSLKLQSIVPELGFWYTTDEPDTHNWVGLYKPGERPDNKDTKYHYQVVQYALAPAGPVYINRRKYDIKSGRFDTYLLKYDYKILASPVSIDTNLNNVAVRSGSTADSLRIYYSTDQADNTNWLAIYKEGYTPTKEDTKYHYSKWQYAPGPSNTLTFSRSDFKDGKYSAYILAKNGYTVLASPIPLPQN